MCQNPNCNNILGQGKRKNCSQKCADHVYYLKNKVKIMKQIREWERLNPEKTKEKRKKSSTKFRREKRGRFNELMRKSYNRNKDKWNCRSLTLKVVHGRHGYIKYPIPNKKCKKCCSKENLEIHHESYPTEVEEIKQAINDVKIYYKCRDCHGRRGTHKT